MCAAATPLSDAAAVSAHRSDGRHGAHPQIVGKARLAIRELLGQIRPEPGEDGSPWAAYEVHPAVLVRDAVSGFAG